MAQLVILYLYYTHRAARQSLKIHTQQWVLKLYAGLRKAESPVLVQAHAGRIGLAKFVYNRKVPGILSVQRRCRAGEETPRNMSLFCTDEAESRQRLRAGGEWTTNNFLGRIAG